MSVKQKKWQSYHTLWIWLMLGWSVSGADRTITGPVVTWMIQNKIAFLASAPNPHALGGLIGSLFFAGYMLTQFPGGYLGDKFGHRTVIAISLSWAAIATLLNTWMVSLIGFIALRVLTGLGEGMYYSNDRTLITETTPLEKRSFGMGVAISGLSVGITVATLFTPFLIEQGASMFGLLSAWKLVFLFFGVASLLVSLVLFRIFKRQAQKPLPYGSALAEIGKYAVVFLIVIIGVYYVSEWAGLSSVSVAIIELVLAFILILFAYRKKGGDLSPVLHNRNLILLYISAIPVLWNLWFFNFWPVSIIANAAHTSFLQATLTAMFNGVAGILGYPAGGWLADRLLEKGFGRKGGLVSFTLVQCLLTLAFGIYLMSGGTSVWVMGSLLFVASLFFNGLQPISHALTADLAEPQNRGAAFGMWNLFGEIGSVLAPVIGGALRDATGNWTSAVMLDVVLIFVSFLLLLFVKEQRATGEILYVREREQGTLRGCPL